MVLLGFSSGTSGINFYYLNVQILGQALGTTTVDVEPVQVVSAFSDDGFVNTVTIEDVVSNLSTGSSSAIINRAATYFGFPILKPDGEP